jgi:hypothetical protein
MTAFAPDVFVGDQKLVRPDPAALVLTGGVPAVWEASVLPWDVLGAVTVLGAMTGDVDWFGAITGTTWNVNTTGSVTVIGDVAGGTTQNATAPTGSVAVIGAMTGVVTRV